MRIIQLATEFAPLAKEGGLGEVVSGLSNELSLMGHEVEVILPKYDFLPLPMLKKINLEIPDFRCFEKGNLHANAMWSAEYGSVKLHLLEARHSAGYFHRKKIYGCQDDVARFIYFSRAAIEYLKLKNRPIEILHLHDWHVALAAVLARDLFNLPIQSIVLTIHNGGHQGLCATWDLDAIGLEGKKYLTRDKLQDNDLTRQNLINLLKGGIIYSDALVAVSPTYAKEILNPTIGFGLEKTFEKEQSKLKGILNGLDLHLWNPENDPQLPVHYTHQDSFFLKKKGKEAARQMLCDRFDLSNGARPWIGTVTRLVDQKGPFLIEETLKQTLLLGGSFLLLGISPSTTIQSHFEMLKKKHAKNDRVLIHLDYDEKLAHQFYAALDFFIIPSLYEPCGLAQMIAMRYGTIPIARATGGHKDTIFDWDNLAIPVHQRNGFLFQNFTKQSLQETLKRAVHQFRQDPDSIQTLITSGMHFDWSWKKPAKEYLSVYTQSCISNSAKIKPSWQGC